MEAASAPEALSAEGLREAERGFRALLRRKRISERFIAAHAEDLFGQAQKEYAGWIAAQNVAANPAGWLINCAWRRTQDLLDAQRRSPTSVSVEEAYHLADTSTPGPGAQAIDRDLSALLQEAVEQLPSREQRLLKLVYFEGYDVFAAGRKLGWTKSTAHRHHHAALERLRAELPADPDALAVEIGLAASLALAEGRHLGLRSLLHGPREILGEAPHRLAELWRRLSPAGDPASASVAGGAARAAGACGAAALACLASGVIGPGVAGIDAVGAKQATPAPRARAARQAPEPKVAPVPSVPATVPVETASEEPEAEAKPRVSTSKPKAHPRKKQTSTPQSSAQQTVQEFGIEGSSGSSTESTSSPTPSVSARSKSGSSSSSSPSSSGSSGSGSQTNSEFGL